MTGSHVTISQDFPPNIEEIRAKFKLDGREIFAWDGTIFAPSGPSLPVWLIEHEKVHFKQQAGEPEKWWKRYLEDDQFRLDQEMEAHRVEYKVFCQYNKDRNAQFMYLRAMARRLASPMYGGIIDSMEAGKRIRQWK